MISIAPHSLGEWAFSEFACAMNPDVVLFPIAFALAATGAFVDVYKRQIPNWLTYTGIVVGFVLRGLLLGWKGMGSALAGCLLAGGIFLLFYVVRAMGAGDVKLVAAIGSLLGPTDALVMLLATAICGGQKHDEGISRSQQRSNRRHQLHVTCSHGAYDVEQQEYSACQQTTGERAAHPFPAQQESAEHESHDDSGIGEPVWDTPLTHVDESSGCGESERDGEKHDIRIHGASKLRECPFTQ